MTAHTLLPIAFLLKTNFCNIFGLYDVLRQFINHSAMLGWFCFTTGHYMSDVFYSVQLLDSVSKKPVSEDESFSKKATVVKKNRYKNKFPCE